MASAFSSLDSSLIFMSLFSLESTDLVDMLLDILVLHVNVLNSTFWMSTRRGTTEVHEFDAMFLGSHAHYKLTSVIGHVFRQIDELHQHHLIKLQIAHFLNLCLVAFVLLFGIFFCHNSVFLLYLIGSVIVCTGFHTSDDRRIYLARLSSVTEKVILKKMNSLAEPNRDEALSTDAHQEMDLKVGVAFTRFQTSYFDGKYGNLDARVISLVLSTLFRLPITQYLYFFLTELLMCHLKKLPDSDDIHKFSSYCHSCCCFYSVLIVLS
ncbi:hypothetical protein MTR67_041846 [Solanum verrucosum]|uniref:DNA topoisomerase n=1 Tax=Solanum verrucosum TaxID=315347 RepID=A0AAF0UNT7_SOLVR|nr:hypothetical protein MTR67_041846 [Solanum verrucosum]